MQKGMPEIGARCFYIIPNSGVVCLVFFGFLFFLCVIERVALGEIIRVPEDTPTIQKALNRSEEGDMILVSPGVYQENLIFPGVGVSLCSLNPTSPTLVQQTIIDGSLAESPVITLTGNEPTTSTLSGFTITGGEYFGIGGGISGQCSDMLIENNLIQENIADFGGGIAQCNGVIQNNIVTKNLAYTEGGGLYDCDGEIFSNQIVDNDAFQLLNRDAPCYGAGMSRCDGIINMNEISKNLTGPQYHQMPHLAQNLATGGGGIALCTARIENNLICNNLVLGLGAGGGRGGGLFYCSGTIDGNLIEGNSTIGPEGGGNGGGGYVVSGKVINNIISKNTSGSGGGLKVLRGSFFNNLVTFNTATGYHASIGFSECDIQNCIIFGNVAGERYGGPLISSSSAINSIIWGNSAPEYPQGRFYSDPLYCCIEGWSDGGEGMTSVNPLFIDPENGDFRLFSTSSLIDAGMFLEGIDSDIAGNPKPIISTPAGLRGDGSGFDIGVYEFQEQADVRGGSQWALF